ncbi:uncharacterized protein B0I36DRAFT_207242, partial [Microdochium trichocladiopsis]
MSDLCESDPSADMTRIEDDKGGLLHNCFDWILENDQLKHWQQSKDARLLWIRGEAGKGKTMLMIGLVNQLARSRSPTSGFAFFFCQNADPRLNNAISVLRGLVWMLLRAHPSLAQYIPKEYRDKKDKRAIMFENPNQTLFSTLKIMLTSILSDACFDRLYILVDALDECSQDSDKLVDLIRQDTTNPHSRAKWLVSGRYTVRLNRELKPSQHRNLLSLELNENHISEAVASFIKQKVDDLVTADNRKLRKQVRDRMMEKAESTFLWAALVCKHLKGLAQLQILEELEKLPPGLAPLYERMMQLIEERGPDLSTRCKHVLRAVSITYRPLTLHELAPVADLWLPLDHLRELVDLCASFVTIRKDTIRFIHQSAKDYLDILHTIFPRTREEEHRQVVTRCLKAMSDTLKRDIYNVRQPGAAIEDVVVPSPDPLFAVRYACTYWIRHLLELNAGLQDGDIMNSVATFLRVHFLHWLEGLSLVKQLPGAVVSLSRLASEDDSLHGLLQDAHRFTMYYRWVIENYPLQVYTSALVFSPARSRVRVTFRHEEPTWIKLKPAMEDEWNECLQTLEGHSDLVTSVVFSHDGCRLASASDDKTVKVWDATTGQCLQTLESHSSGVNSVVFSHDGCRLASASRDNTVKVWDATTGQCLQTLEGHSDPVNSVVFSHDGCRLASASGDKTV